MDPISYKGFTIEEETHPWALKYKCTHKFYNDGERVRSGYSIEDCKEQIDELTLDLEG